MSVTARRRVSVRICDACRARLPEGNMPCEGISMLEIGDGERLNGACVLCDGTGTWEIEQVELAEEAIQDLRASIHACENEGCGGGHRDSEEGETFGRDTNMTIWDEIPESIPDTSAYGALILYLVETDDFRFIKWPDLACPACGAALDGWGTEVKVRTHQVLVERLTTAPEEIVAINTTTPAEAIEWSRSDCSTSLVHLTRGEYTPVHVDNIDYTPREEKLTAPEILWAILTSRVLRAVRGKRMTAAAVCFTEKPLGALKDTVLGAEARVRRKRRARRWPAYGLMFDKSYLRTLGVRPVIHVEPKDMGKLAPEFSHLAVRLDDAVNWLHEREWRAGADVHFDPSRAVVLVPTFEQAEIFREALARRRIRVRGFLPLHDVFAAI